MSFRHFTAALCCASTLMLPRTSLRAQQTEDEYGATAQVDKKLGGERSVELEETRAVAGSLGDPLRVLQTLPGVTPIASGLPYGYVRGAPPGTLGYYYDGIPLPQLYHLGLGPAVLHPRLFGPIEFRAGVPSARFGRRLGGSVEASAPEPYGPPAYEAELRLLDANAYVQEPLGDGMLRLAARYGYPGLVLSLFEPNATLSYWDYGTRWLQPLESGSRVELIAFGSSDALHNPPVSEGSVRFDDMAIEFHRLEARLVHRGGGVEVGSALRLGYDRSSLDQELTVRALSLGPRAWLSTRLSPELRLRAGADMLGSVGEIDSVQGQLPPVVAGRRDLRVDLPVYAEAAGRNAGGSFLELLWKPAPTVAAELGARADVWVVEGKATGAFDPRLRLTWSPLAELDLHIAGGITHQPAVFLYPIPGLTEVALDRGLQRALQSDAGVGLQLPLGYRIEVQGFLHHYARLMLPELYAPIEGASVSTVEALSYGIEGFLRMPRAGRLSGWISYTLGWARAWPEAGPAFAPEFDVRHVLNTVAQFQLLERLQLGARVHVRSGRPFNHFEAASAIPTYEVRLAPFARLDTRIAYRFEPDWGELLLYAEWLNLTFAQESLGAECLYGSCQAQTAPAIVLPNLGVRAQW
ncbi:MAG: Plug domain-containing protein [Myxococcales bacterium]|nr:Plug domain-containing protein [Myxococcales bacterium]